MILDPTTVLVVASLLVALLLVRVPVAFSLLASGVVGIYLVQGMNPAQSVMARMPYDTVSSFTMIIIPLFVALGVMASRGRLAVDGFAAAARLTHRLPGGLGIASVMACAAFAAVSGSSAATVVALGPTAVKEMIRHGYDKTVAAGVVGAAGTLGILIPPSVALVLYGILTRESISALLLAGIVPGLLSALAFAVAVLIRAKVQPHLFGRRVVADQDDAQATISVPAEQEFVGATAGQIGAHTAADSATDPHVGSTARADGSVVAADLPPSQSLQDFRISSLVRLAALFGVIMGGIYLGIATVTEAAALGALLALVFYIFDLFDLPRGTRAEQAKETFAESVRLTGMTMALLIGGAVFSYFLVIAGVPAAFGDWVVTLSAPAVVIAALIIMGFLVLGMFIDGLSIMLIAVPLTYPVMMDLGYGGIWFGIIVVKAIEIGLITPPFGLNAYMVAGTTPGLDVKQAFRGVLWFLPLELGLIVVLFMFPDLVTWLPAMAGH